MSANKSTEKTGETAALPAAGTRPSDAAEEDVFAKQEKLFTGGTSEMPS